MASSELGDVNIAHLSCNTLKLMIANLNIKHTDVVVGYPGNGFSFVGCLAVLPQLLPCDARDNIGQEGQTGVNGFVSQVVKLFLWVWHLLLYFLFTLMIDQNSSHIDCDDMRCLDGINRILLTRDVEAYVVVTTTAVGEESQRDL